MAISGANVSINERVVGVTQEDGSVQATVPVRNQIHISVERGEISDEGTLSGLLAPILWGATMGLGTVAISTYGLSAAGYRSQYLASLSRRLAAKMNGCLGKIVGGLITMFVTGSAAERTDEKGLAEPAVTVHSTSTASSLEGKTNWEPVWAAWTAMVNSLPEPAQTDTLTPAELTHRAIECGYPEGDMQEFLSAFQKARYSSCELSDAELAAVASIREQATGEHNE
jgi:hypothetical protein